MASLIESIVLIDGDDLFNINCVAVSISDKKIKIEISDSIYRKLPYNLIDWSIPKFNRPINKIGFIKRNNDSFEIQGYWKITKYKEKSTTKSLRVVLNFERADCAELNHYEQV